MHYANGREAKNGDKVVQLPQYGAIDPKTGKVFANAVVGILYDAVAGNDYCNGRIAPISPTDTMPNLKECLHLEDVLAAIATSSDCAPPKEVPAAQEIDVSAEEPPTETTAS